MKHDCYNCYFRQMDWKSLTQNKEIKVKCFCDKSRLYGREIDVPILCRYYQENPILTRCWDNYNPPNVKSDFSYYIGV